MNKRFQRGTEEIRKLLKVKRNTPLRKDLAEQMDKLVSIPMHRVFSC